MGDVNLEIKLSNLDERVIQIEESGGGSGGDGYITSVSNDFNVVNKKLSLSNDITTKLAHLDENGKLSADDVKSGTNAKSNLELTNELSNTVGYIDVSNGSTRYLPSNLPFIADKDYWANCAIKAEQDKWGIITINGIAFASTMSQSYTSFLFPIKKGQSINTTDCTSDSFIDLYPQIK